jgi:hypothetical protein
MKKTYLMIFISSVLIGCSSVTYYHDPKTGLDEKRSSYMLEMFTDSVDEDIKRELRGEPLKIDWREYWIERCKNVSSYKEGGACIHYIINKRREAGLPDIPEIEKM